MSQSVSARFTAAEAADVNQVAASVSLVLGDYANSHISASLATSSSDFSADYPAAGAIDGDRTELNVGPASGAENGIGRASWRSGGVPDVGDTVSLAIDFGTARTFNRTKLYHLNGFGLKYFRLQYYDGSGWVNYAQTATPGGAGVNVVTTYQLDTIDHPDVTAQQIRIVITGTQVANDKANVVALEVYRLIDISSRVKSVNVSRQRDYKLNNNLAATCSITCDNGDRFFSPSYVPTVAEAAAGYVNGELRPNLGIIVKKGFAFGGAQELVSEFVGSIDGIKIRSTAREATIDARDGIKQIINQVTSTTLKTNKDIGLLVTFLLNLANVSTYEVSADLTTIIIDSFFTFEESVLTSLQKLVEACGDAAFFFDENGIARFKMYLNSVPHNHTDTSQADFAAGTYIQNVDLYTLAGALIPYFNTRSGSSWTIQTDSILQAVGGGGALSVQLPSSLAQLYGTWQTKLFPSSGVGTWWFAARTGFFLTPGRRGYGLTVSSTQLKIIRQDGASCETCTPPDTTLFTVTRTPASGDVYKITRDGANLFTVFVNGTSQGTFTDATYTTSAGSGASFDSTGSATFTDPIIINAAGTITTHLLMCEFQSQVVDQSSSVTSEDIFDSTYANAGGAILTWYSATSADNITYDAWVAMTAGGTMGSTAKRYIKWRAVFNIPATAISGTLPSSNSTIYDTTINWSVSTGGSQKYPATPSYNLRYDGALLDLEEEFVDNLGGDTAIVNDASVTSAPIVLTGTSSDTTWQATVGTPAAPVSVTNSLGAVGTMVFDIVVASGMDTSLMTGVNPAAAVVAIGGGGAGTWSFTKINPTHPQLTIVMTTPGTITDLRLIGKLYSAAEFPYQATAFDTPSINYYGRRSLPIQNDYIINNGVAALIAGRLIDNFKNPVTYISRLQVRPLYSAQLGDRITLTDLNTGIAFDFLVVGLAHYLGVDVTSIQAYTEAVLIKVP